MKRLIYFCLIGFSLSVQSQVAHDHPYFPKGNPATQLKALPYYNHACRLVSEDNKKEAERELRKAINISFDLVEAQLFLADLLKERNQLDSALYFYKSGIDFVLEQDERYYFELFDLSHRLGEYEILKQYIKYYTKIHGIPQKLNDVKENMDKVMLLEKYEKSLSLIYDYTSWKPSHYAIKELPLKSENNILLSSNSISIQEANESQKIINGKVSTKKRHENFLPFGTINAFILNDFCIYSKNVSGKTALYIAYKEGKKWSNPKYLSEQINSTSCTDFPFYSVIDSSLYFSGMVNGQKDLFVVKYNPTLNTAKEVIALDRINTSGDEIAPYIHDGIFYFSSNGLPGFGGFDIYETSTSETINGLIFPTNARNSLAILNSMDDEIQLFVSDKGTFSVLKKNYKAEKKLSFFKKSISTQTILYEIGIH